MGHAHIKTSRNLFFDNIRVVKCSQIKIKEEIIFTTMEEEYFIEIFAAHFMIIN